MGNNQRRSSDGSRSVRVAAVLVAGWLAGLAAASAQAPTGHEHHMAMAAEASVAKKSQVMASQPKLEGVTLVDASGKTVPLADAVTADTPVLVDFIFTTCTTICPVMTAGFSQLEHQLADEHRPVRLVSISRYDPELDTPAALRRYASEHHAGADWRFLTGTPAASEAAQRAFGAFRGSKESHVPITFIRRTRAGAWEQLDGLASGDALHHAYLGE